MNRFAVKQSFLRSVSPLPIDRIIQMAPSVAATTHAENLSNRYAQINTLNVLEGLEREGFRPYEVRTTMARSADTKETCKHMLRLRHATQGPVAVGEIFPEIVLTNSHDGTSAYHLMAGLFRLVCSNGMIRSESGKDVRVRHSGNVVDNVIEGSYRVLEDLKELPARVNALSAVSLSDDERYAFARAALQLRYDEGEAPFPAERLLLPKRWQDRGNNLWKTTNVIQENMIGGGVRGRNANGRRTSTRPVGSIGENVRLNRALWSLADEMAKLKA